MSILKEADFYYGAVLSTLINRGICPALVESGKDRQIYDFVTNKKESQIAITSWTPRGKNLGHGWSRRIYP